MASAPSSSAAAAAATAPSGKSNSSSPPVAVVCVGMAGSGKTTFMQRINAHLHSKGSPPYIMNLDPAVRNIPFNSNIDIRDSVNYKEVMKQYNLGPNGGILTSLNLFATKVDQILGLLEKRAGGGSSQDQTAGGEEQKKKIEHILVDTPGQIEVFVWSASGDILLGALASSFPTVLAYIIDTPRTASTSTFMSNMLYACSILYKTKLPMILVFNKTDVQDAEFAKEWMTDFEAFQAGLAKEEKAGEFGGEGGVGFGGSGYMGSLLNSMSLVLEEFYSQLSVVGVSSMTGEGVDEFFDAVKEKAKEFERDYKPELERRQKQRADEKEGKRQEELGKLMRDMAVGGGGNTKPKTKSKSKDGGPTISGGRRRTRPEPETVSEAEDMSEDDEDGYEHGIVDPDPEFEEGGEDDDQEVGLETRYKQAMSDSKEKGAADEDFSFARYMHKANMS